MPFLMPYVIVGDIMAILVQFLRKSPIIAQTQTSANLCRQAERYRARHYQTAEIVPTVAPHHPGSPLRS